MDQTILNFRWIKPGVAKKDQLTSPRLLAPHSDIVVERLMRLGKQAVVCGKEPDGHFR
ncbi:MAG TPA: hypothetical protein VI566_08750 [Xanthomonadales bacterium]|nr:hypothetical protein [Xanthomonadales bacterium]